MAGESLHVSSIMSDQNTAAHLNVEAKVEALSGALLGDDELGAVVRGHIYIENELIAFIKARLPKPEAIKDRDIDYNMRVKLAVALGLDPSFEPALNFVGSLRNQFAHSLEARIGKQEAVNFEKALGAHRAITSAAYRQVHIHLGTEAAAIPTKQQEPKDRIILCFVTLWAGILIEAHAAALARSEDQP
ncbi:hypothetical protein ASF33_17010 [Methylobacterium sp. Leaf92]|nr:hypothetical protein ASF33_17010 [Methylobacterium sp. Leaf92]